MAKVRIEWVRLNALSGAGGAAMDQPEALFGAAIVVAVGPTATSLTAPAISPRELGVEGLAYARITGLSGAVNVAWGDAPVAGEGAGWRIEAGRFALVPVKSSQAISLIAALDPPAAGSSTPVRASAVSRAGVIAVGGVAQDLMPANADRNGWLLQNQSAANLYIRSKSVTGALLATADQNSLIVPPGGYYEPPKITPNALSIVGGAAGQSFFAEEW